MITKPGTQSIGPHETLGQILELLRNRNFNRLADLYADDAVHEVPFAPPPAPRRLEGREQVRAHFTKTLAKMSLNFHEFEKVAVHDTSDPEVIVAEYDVHGTVATSGRRFVTRNIWVLRITDGMITLWRDYWNPLEITELQQEG